MTDPQNRSSLDGKDIKIVIRDAQHDDAAAIAQLLGELGYPNTPEFAMTKIQRMTGRRQDRILVAEKHSRVVGVLSLHIMPLLHKRGDLCRVSSLVVTGKSRGQHIGCRLMEMAEIYARANNCAFIEITSGDHRVEAHGFYTKIGYKISAKRFVKSLHD